jgi:hypothetical protein
VEAVATPTNPLPDPHSYVVTGNYAVGSIDLPAHSAAGVVNGTIHINTCNPQANPPIVTNCVPANADIVAAYLYFEMIDTDPLATSVKFRGAPIINSRFSSLVKRSDQAVLGPGCFAASGALSLTMFRADVRYLLPVQYDANNQPTGKRLVGDGDLTTNKDKNGQFYPAGLTVETLEGGTGNQTPAVAGFSLFVVYRDPTEPLRKIVVYENPKNEPGSPGQVYIQTDLNTVTMQTFAGIYKSATDTKALFTLAGATNQKNTTREFGSRAIRAQPQHSWRTMATTPS